MNIRLFPVLVAVSVIFFSCGSDSPNEDISKEWTLIDLNYSGSTAIVGDVSSTTDFDGQIIGGDARMFFKEDPNVVNTQGAYKIQLESRKDEAIRLSQPDQTFDQLGTWMRDGNVITTSGDNSLTSALTIAKLTDGRMDFDFDYSFSSSISGANVQTNVDGTYFLASSEYINNWTNEIKGGWILTAVDYRHYEGIFSEFDGSVDFISIGSYAFGTAPIQFGANGEFLSPGSYTLDIARTDHSTFGTNETTTSTQSNSLLEDGSYMVVGNSLTVTSNSGSVKSYTVIDVTSEKLTFFEIEMGEPSGPFGLVESRSRIKYTLERKDFVAPQPATILGTWNLTGYNADIDLSVLLDGVLVSNSKSNNVSELISSTSQITVSDNPRTIVNSGSFVIKTTIDQEGIMSTIEEDGQSFSGDNWIKTDTTLQVFSPDIVEGSVTFVIEELKESILVLRKDFDESKTVQEFEFTTKGYITYTFEQ